MPKYSDRSPKEWEDLTEKWHSDPTIQCSLQQFLGLSDIEYLRFAHGIGEDVPDEEVTKNSSEITREIVTELAIKPKLQLWMYLFDQ